MSIQVESYLSFFSSAVLPDGSLTRISRKVYIVPAGHWCLPVKARVVGGNSISSAMSPAATLSVGQ